MERDELDELHYITPIDNLPSISRLGILSHKRAGRIEHKSVAKEAIQQLRAGKRVPGGLLLHEYVNLYICARNPMLFKRKNCHRDLCVLQISTDVLDLPGVVITDGNAAAKSAYTRFYPAPGGLSNLDKKSIFARYWTDPNQAVQYRRASMKCAEVLVPNRVDPGMIIGAYVSCAETLKKFDAMQMGMTARVNGDLFFQ